MNQDEINELASDALKEWNANEFAPAEDPYSALRLARDSATTAIERVKSACNGSFRAGFAAGVKAAENAAKPDSSAANPRMTLFVDVSGVGDAACLVLIDTFETGLKLVVECMSFSNGFTLGELCNQIYHVCMSYRCRAAIVDAAAGHFQAMQSELKQRLPGLRMVRASP